MKLNREFTIAGVSPLQFVILGLLNVQVEKRRKKQSFFVFCETKLYCVKNTEKEKDIRKIKINISE